MVALWISWTKAPLDIQNQWAMGRNFIYQISAYSFWPNGIIFQLHLDYPEIAGVPFPLLNHHLGGFSVVWGCYNLTRISWTKAPLSWRLTRQRSLGLNSGCPLSPRMQSSPQGLCPRNLQQDPHFTDPSRTWVSNSSHATYNVRGPLGFGPIQFWMECMRWWFSIHFWLYGFSFRNIFLGGKLQAWSIRLGKVPFNFWWTMIFFSFGDPNLNHEPASWKGGGTSQGK